MKFKNSKKALVMRNIILAVIALIVLGVVIYIAFGPAFIKTVKDFFNRTEEITEKAEQYRPGEIISNLPSYLIKHTYPKNLIVNEIV